MFWDHAISGFIQKFSRDKDQFWASKLFDSNCQKKAQSNEKQPVKLFTFVKILTASNKVIKTFFKKPQSLFYSKDWIAQQASPTTSNECLLNLNNKKKPMVSSRLSSFFKRRLSWWSGNQLMQLFFRTFQIHYQKSFRSQSDAHLNKASFKRYFATFNQRTVISSDLDML